jgi:hypothetical protein
MLNPPSQIVRFAGPVSWQPGPGAAGITLLGTLDEPGATPAQLSLIGTEAVQLPANLTNVTAEVSPAAGVVLRAAACEWRIPCRSWQLHRDVGATFYVAVPPRPTPWSRRLTWRVLLGVAATAPGRWLLSRQIAKKSNHA